MAISSAIGIGRSALLAHQTAIRTVSENIGNVETEGYARRRVDFEADRSGGVRSGVVQRIVDRFLESRIVDSNSERTGAEARAAVLERVEALLPLGDASLTSALDRFFDAAGELATHPEDIAVRQNLLEQAEALAVGFRAAAGGLDRLQHEVDERLVDELQPLNAELAEIARLNDELGGAEPGSAPALEDRRDAALAALGERVAIRTVAREDGTVDVMLRDSGVALVIGSEASSLVARIAATPALDGATLHQVALQLAGGGTAGLPGAFGGRLGGLLAVRDQDLPNLVGELDTLALAFRDEINAIQTDPGASDLDGATGSAFFGGTRAAELTVLLADPRGIAAAIGGTPSDNRNALLLSDLRGEQLVGLGGATLAERSSGIVAAAGAALRGARDAGEVAGSLGIALRSQRDAVSAVSLDEELTDLIRFQRGFQAAAQLIRMGDSLLEDLLGVLR